MINRVKAMIGNRLKKTRERKHMTQEQAARKFRVSSRTYRAWERGQAGDWLNKAFDIFKFAGLISVDDDDEDAENAVKKR